MILWDKLKSLSALYEKLSEPIKQKYQLTQLEFDILMFLHNNPQYNTANDIVKIRHFAKSHVSTSISSLKEKGLLKRNGTETKRKNILLELTPNAKEIISEGMGIQSAFGNILIQGISNEEIERFHELFIKICENADMELEGRK